MALGGGEASSVPLHVVAVNEAKVKLGFHAQFQPIERCVKGIVRARLSPSSRIGLPPALFSCGRRAVSS
jgi:hypothetical protein